MHVYVKKIVATVFSVLPQWQKSEEMTKKLSGSARNLEKICPYMASLSVLRDPTSTGITVNWPFLLQSDTEIVVLTVSYLQDPCVQQKLGLTPGFNSH